MTLPAPFSRALHWVQDYIRRSFNTPGDPAAAESSPRDAEFNRLAMAVFALQYEHVPPYRRLCEVRRIRPDTIERWESIPAMPTSAFKDLELTILPRKDRPRVFLSSGTTEQQTSRHFHNSDSLSLYEHSLVPWFQAHLFPERTRAVSYIHLTLPMTSHVYILVFVGLS
jgi:phenylacetate-coenzyme A ligase PaaK-like adenylate-forming protein